MMGAVVDEESRVSRGLRSIRGIAPVKPVGGSLLNFHDVVFHLPVRCRSKVIEVRLGAEAEAQIGRPRERR